MITPAFGLTATERVLPKLALDFTTASLDPRITFTRTTSAVNPATYINSSGVVTAATNNQPRFDYDPSILVCKGLLIEESRTNAIVNSNAVAVSLGWTTSQVGTATLATTANYSVSPDGTTTATRVIFNNNGGTGTGNFATFQQAIAGRTIGVSYADSIWLKTNDNSTVTLIFRDDTGGRFNQLITVTPTWTRFSLAGAATGTGNQCCKIWIRAGVGTSTYADISAWGGQSETGAFATSYIPTTSAALTRNADVATMTGTNFSDWYNQTEGTFTSKYTPIMTSAAASNIRGPVIVDGGSYHESFNLGIQSGQNALRVYDGGVTQVDISKGSISAGTTYQIAGAYKLNDFAVAVNGGAVSTDTSATVPTPNRVSIGYYFTGGTFFSGWVKNIMYWPSRLSNAEVQAFSKQG